VPREVCTASARARAGAAHHPVSIEQNICTSIEGGPYHLHEAHVHRILYNRAFDALVHDVVRPTPVRRPRDMRLARFLNGVRGDTRVAEGLEVLVRLGGRVERDMTSADAPGCAAVRVVRWRREEDAVGQVCGDACVALAGGAELEVRSLGVVRVRVDVGVGVDLETAAGERANEGKERHCWLLC